MFKLHTEAFLRDLAKAATAFPAKTKTALTRTSQAAAVYARVSRLYKSHTYTLRGSIKDQGLTKDFTARVVADAGYAYWVENGTRPHVIEPHRKKVLRFEKGGEIFFRRRVFHPGTAPRPFMQEGADKSTPLFERLCLEAVSTMFQ